MTSTAPDAVEKIPDYRVALACGTPSSWDDRCFRSRRRHQAVDHCASRCVGHSGEDKLIAGGPDRERLDPFASRDHRPRRPGRLAVAGRIQEQPGAGRRPRRVRWRCARSQRRPADRPRGGFRWLTPERVAGDGEGGGATHNHGCRPRTHRLDRQPLSRSPWGTAPERIRSCGPPMSPRSDSRVVRQRIRSPPAACTGPRHPLSRPGCQRAAPGGFSTLLPRGAP